MTFWGLFWLNFLLYLHWNSDINLKIALNNILVQSYGCLYAFIPLKCVLSKIYSINFWKSLFGSRLAQRWKHWFVCLVLTIEVYASGFDSHRLYICGVDIRQRDPFLHFTKNILVDEFCRQGCDENECNNFMITTKFVVFIHIWKILKEKDWDS